MSTTRPIRLAVFDCAVGAGLGHGTAQHFRVRLARRIATTAMIGDTTYDILMALSAGTTAIGVSWGYHPPEELRAAGAHAVVDAAHQVRPVWREVAGGRLAKGTS